MVKPYNYFLNKEKTARRPRFFLFLQTLDAAKAAVSASITISESTQWQKIYYTVPFVAEVVMK